MKAIFTQRGRQAMYEVERRKHAIISLWPTFWAFVSLALAAWGCAAFTDGLARLP